MKLLALLLMSAAIAPGEGGSADLAVSQTSPDAQQAAINGRTVYAPITYTIKVTNNGPDVAFNAHLTDTPSAPVRSTSANCSGSGPVECDLGDLQPGQSAEVTVETQPENGNQLENKATARSQTPDPQPDNDSSSYTPNVVVVDRGPMQPPPATPDRSAAHAVISRPAPGTAKSVEAFRGRASDDKSGVKAVEIAVRRKGGRRCSWLKDTKARFTTRRKTASGCADQVWLKATGTTHWTYTLTKSLPKGSYVLIARATDGKGNTEKSFTTARDNLVAFKVR